MKDLLFLAHRLPFPPNKGDKVRSYRVLKHLAKGHRLHVGTFLDDPSDEAHVEPLRRLCADLHVVRLDPRWAKLKSLVALGTGEALTLRYYRNEELRAWVERTVRDERIDTAVAFSAAMAQYVDGLPGLRMLIDFVDVDSAKWTQYAASRPWPSSWIYRREGERLLRYERAVASRAVRSFFVTEAEVDLFRRLAPECKDKIEAISNGVDAGYFSPEQGFSSPYEDGEMPIVFTGAMDYWPNVDAVQWFVSDVLPALRSRSPRSRFFIVGMRPAAAVQALRGESVVVTGTVPDVRPYLAHAAVVVAPLRVARGVQNKVLEAMAMARATVVSDSCAAALDAVVGRDVVAASDAAGFVKHVGDLLQDPERRVALGAAARQRILAGYGWEAHLSRMDRFLEAAAGGSSPAGPPNGHSAPAGFGGASRSAAATASPVPLTFVIPVRNDGVRLARCIASIHASAGAVPIRVLVADNGSTDDTVARARAAGAEVVELPGLRVGAVRNEAAQVAGSGLLGFVDSDHELGPGWIAAALDVMEDERVGGTGCVCHAPPGGTWVQRIYDALRGRPRGRQDVEWLGAGNMVVRADVFASLGGFDVSLEACEDADLCNRLRAAGWRLVSDERLENIHYGDPSTLGRLFKSELWRGRDNLRVTLRGPLTWRAMPSLLVPIANLVAIIGLLVSPLRAPALGGLALGAPALVLGGTIALRSLRIFAALERRSLLDPWRALAVGATYEIARALALVWRAPHHRASRG